MFLFLTFLGVCAILFFIYRIWDQLPDMIMTMKEQTRELIKIREILEKLSDSNQ